MLPILLFDHQLQPCPHRRHSPAEPAEGTEAIGGLVQEPGAGWFGEIGRGLLEGRIEEGRHQPQICAERAEFVDEVVFALADDALMIHLVQRRLPPSRLAAMVDRLKQRRHPGEAVRPVFRLPLQMLVQTLMPRLPGILPPGSQPCPEMHAHQRMRVQHVRVVVAGLSKEAEIAQVDEQFLPYRIRRWCRSAAEGAAPPFGQHAAVFANKMIGQTRDCRRLA
ncbi:MAG: hypothetical protein OEU92_12295 [Alphaproteobacteria bacterium]|nr:hypothetical protein [Alphaproteobacteria bacterium]